MSNTETYRFEWKRHRIAGSTWQTDFAKQKAEPGYIDYKKFTDAHRLAYGVAYLHASDLDLAEIECRAIILADRSMTAYDDEVEVHEVTIGARFVVIDGMGRPVGPVHHGSKRFETEAEAEKALAKWRKESAKWWAERAQLEAIKPQVMALPSGTAPAGIIPAHTGTKVGDVVLVKGHGYLRAGLVIEETSTRVKVAYMSRASRNEGGLPYAKWVKRAGLIAA